MRMSLSGAVETQGIGQALRDGVVDETHLRGEIGAVLLGQVPGRKNAADITVYKSLGHIAQHIATAQAMYQNALARPEFADVAW